tara:strand:+ start:137 stop:352 length:216 start_codon:yes stop_codon:yes gene_type:complete
MAINKYDEAVRQIANGYMERFAETAAADERVHELMMDLASEFVENEMPIVSEDSQTDVAMELIMGVTMKTV